MKTASFLAEIETRHAARRQEDRQRSLPTEISPISFSHNDYLGLSQHPVVIEAAQQALQKYGVSARAARLLAGPCPEH